MDPMSDSDFIKQLLGFSACFQNNSLPYTGVPVFSNQYNSNSALAELLILTGIPPNQAFAGLIAPGAANPVPASSFGCSI